ncbi:MAG: hypothetical protein U0414_10245 [Polyangiaceae bacterium]
MVQAQPGVSLGDVTNCAVSGVVFVVQEWSPNERLGDDTIYFCCDECHAYFRNHAAEVRRLRGWD